MTKSQEIKIRGEAAESERRSVYKQLRAAGYSASFCQKESERAEARVYESWPIEGEH